MFGPTSGQGQDPVSAYSQLNRGQTTQIVQEFISRFRNTNDPQAQRYAQLNPSQVTPAQRAEMHQYAGQQHPGILQEMMKHPVITAALGGFAAYELHMNMEQHQH